jgi:hypothetical protein
MASIYVVIAFAAGLVAVLLIAAELLLAIVALLPQLYEIDSDDVECDGMVDKPDIARAPVAKTSFGEGA